MGEEGYTMHETTMHAHFSPQIFWMKPWLGAIWQALRIKIQEIIDLCTSNHTKKGGMLSESEGLGL